MPMYPEFGIQWKKLTRTVDRLQRLNNPFHFRDKSTSFFGAHVTHMVLKPTHAGGPVFLIWSKLAPSTLIGRGGERWRDLGRPGKQVPVLGTRYRCRKPPIVSIHRCTCQWLSPRRSERLGPGSTGQYENNKRVVFFRSERRGGVLLESGDAAGRAGPGLFL